MKNIVVFLAHYRLPVKLIFCTAFGSALLCTSILFHHSVSVCVLHLSCVYVVASSPKSIPFISATNIPFIHFIYHSPSLSYLPYLVMLMLHCHSALLSRYIKKHDFCLNIFIHELISTLMHQSLISRT